jgi:peroxiredoxin
MLKRFFTLFLAAGLAAGLALAKTPRPLANVTVHTPDLKGVDLKKFHGKTVALVIFSTTCKDCISILQMMDKIQTDYGKQGLQVVGAAGDDNAKYMIGSFIARYRPSFPIGYLSKEEIIKVADVPKDVRPVAPIILFIDRWGMVREQYYGDSPVFKDADRALRALCQSMIRVTPAGTTEAPTRARKPAPPQN